MSLLAGTSHPLLLNFPQTSLPDRHLLTKLISFVTDYSNGDKKAISATTGIPTCKIEPIIRYAQGTGLVNAKKVASQWYLSLKNLRANRAA